MDPTKISHARALYNESLKAMIAEIDALLSFAVDFRPEEATVRLLAAKTNLETELEESR